MNKVVLIGRITKDPELRYTQSGTAVVSFIIAVDRDYKDERSNTPTDFIPCNAWRSQAEFIGRYIKKGYLLALSGMIQTRSYQDNQGNNKVITEVVVDSVKNLTPKDNNQPQTKSNPNSNVKGNGQGQDFVKDEDLPF